MTKKKQRKGRKAKKESKQVDRSEVSDDDSSKGMTAEKFVKREITRSIKFEKENEILEPLYPLLTTFQIINRETNGILESFNIQDYDCEDESGDYVYKIALQMHQKVSNNQARSSKVKTISNIVLFNQTSGRVLPWCLRFRCQG